MPKGRLPLFPLLVAVAVLEAAPVSLLLGRLAVIALPLAAAGLLVVYLLLGLLASGVLELGGRKCSPLASGLAASIALAPSCIVLLVPSWASWLSIPAAVAASAAVFRRLCSLHALDSLVAAGVVLAAWGLVVLAGLTLRYLLPS